MENQRPPRRYQPEPETMPPPTGGEIRFMIFLIVLVILWRWGWLNWFPLEWTINLLVHFGQWIVSIFI